LPSGDAFLLTSLPLNIHGLDNFGNTQNITAHISDFFSNPVSPGQQAQFQTDFANVSGSAVFSDGGSGSSRATANIISAAPAPVDGFVTLEASTIGGGHSKILSLAAVDQYTFYAGTDGGGIFKTLNGGATWNHIGTPLKGLGASKSKDLTGSIVRGLTLDTAQPNFVYAATEKGVFLSSDAGQSWKSLMQRQRISGDTLGIVGGTAAFNKTSGANGRLYDAALGADPYTYGFNYTHTAVRSRTTIFIDGVPTTSYRLSGQGIQLIGNAGVTADVPAISVTAGSVITADYDTLSIVPDLPAWDVAIDSTSTFDNVLGYSVIYAAVYGGGVWKSEDYGASWKKRTAMVANGGTFDDRVTTLAINPRSATTTDLFVGTDGSGIYRSQNSGLSWQRMGGLANSVVQDIVLAKTPLAAVKDVWVAGKNGVYASTDAAAAVTQTTPAWTVATGFGANIDVRALARDSSADGTLYAAAYGDITGKSNPLGGLYINATPALVAWTKLTNLDTYSATGAHRLDALAVVGAVGNDTVVAGTEGRAVYNSGDSGVTWTKRVGSGTTALTNTLFTTMEVLHSGTTSLDIFPLTTTYQPMDDYNQAGLGYTQKASTIYHGETHTFTLRLSDVLGNRLSASTNLIVVANIGTVVLNGAAQPLVDGIYGGTDYDITWTNDLVASDYGENAALAGSLVITVTSPNGATAASVPRTFIKPLSVALTVSAGGDPYTATVTASGGSAGAGANTYAGGYYITAPSSCGINAGVGCTAAATAPNFTGTTVTFDYPAAAGAYTINVRDNATGETASVVATFQ
ncbi:MAG: hypothetical protein Q9M19_05085, partial [Mariprofundaceae bacterium]|nr:hypothetical protein [Mariprofundaceae bacterium]